MDIVNSVSRLRSFFHYWYLQWELATAIYMMEPMEKAIIHSILFAIIGILVYAGMTYIPPHFLFLTNFFEGDTDPMTE